MEEIEIKKAIEEAYLRGWNDREKSINAVLDKLEVSVADLGGAIDKQGEILKGIL